MIGFDTSIKEEDSPFHRDNNPSFFIKFEPFWRIDPFYCACLVCKTQKGFVAIDEPIPAIPEHLIVSMTEPGSKPKKFLHFS